MQKSTRTPPKTVKQLVDCIGRAKFEGELGHAPQVVSRAIQANKMPAHWFFECRDLCEAVGITVPEHLFRKSHGPTAATTKQNANDDLAIQGEPGKSAGAA